MNKDNPLHSEQSKTFCICGLPFSALSEEQIINLIKESINSANKITINSPNLNFLRTAENNNYFHNALLNSEILIPDGMPIIWIAKLLKIPINQRIAGSSLISRLISNLSDFPLSVFYFGGAKGVSRKAHRITNLTRGKSYSVGYLDPGFGNIQNLSKSEYIEKINVAKPNLLLVSLPALKGVSWIESNRNALNVNILICSGATVNFIAGNIKRAPKLLQNIGLEWLWRIKEEPILIKRYLLDGIWFMKTIIFKILPLVLLRLFVPLIVKKQNNDLEINQNSNSSMVITLPTFCDFLAAENFSSIFKNYKNISNLTLNASRTCFIDSRFIGEMILVKNKFSNQKIDFNITEATFMFKIFVQLFGVKNIC